MCSEKVNLKDLKWTDEDFKNNAALKQNFYKINMMNCKTSILGILDTQLGNIEKLLENLEKYQQQAEKINDTDMKKDYKATYKQYKIYLEGVKSKTKAALTYMNDLDIELKGTKKISKPRVKKVKKE